jgi:hypothetical protein
MLNRDIYFNSVRSSLFGGSFDQGQVDGQNYILDVWEAYLSPEDLRWLAYPLATALHETASTMLPIAEYGKGQGMEYGKVDPETGQVYYGRGFVQCTWRDNYRRADEKLNLAQFNLSCEWDADLQLDAEIAAATMFRGMIEGWFRSDSQGKQTLGRWFNDTTDDAYMAREIINGDKTKVPSWSGGVSIGNLIAGYHKKFLAALESAAVETVPPVVPPAEVAGVSVGIQVPPGVPVSVFINGELVFA